MHEFLAARFGRGSFRREPQTVNVAVSSTQEGDGPGQAAGRPSFRWLVLGCIDPEFCN